MSQVYNAVFTYRWHIANGTIFDAHRRSGRKMLEVLWIGYEVYVEKRDEGNTRGSETTPVFRQVPLQRIAIVKQDRM